MTPLINPVLVSAYRKRAALERFAFRRAQLLDGLDWSAMTMEFICQAARDEEDLACNLFEITVYIHHLECRW